MKERSPFSLRAYIGLFAAVTVALLAATADDLWRQLPDVFFPWIAFVVLFGFVEFADVNFHDERGRIGLSTSEAVLVPMLVSLPFVMLLWGVALAMALGRELGRLSGPKGIFNVAQYTVAIAVAGLTWETLRDSDAGSFGVVDAVAATVSIVVFALLTQLFVSLAISLAEGRPFFRLFGGAIPAIGVNLQGSIALGLLLAAAYLTTPWTIVLFPLLIAILFTGYRALLAHGRERDRVESLHAASRALAASPDVADAVINFLRAVREIVSAAEARVVLVNRDQREWLGLNETWSAVRFNEVIARTAPLDDPAMRRMADRVESMREDRVANQVGSSPFADIAELLGASELLAVPLLLKGSFVGCLMVLDRVGTDEFSEEDVKLLDALAGELVVRLESYSLFAQVADERERFARIFHGSTEGICLIDSSGVVQAWNPALERITGYAASEVMERVWSDVVMIRDLDQHRIAATELVVVPPDQELEVVTKQGPTRWVSLLSGPVQASEGGGWVVLLRDVSAEHEVEQAKSDFLSTISHELRTPLTTIKGSLQVLGRGTENLPPDLTEQMIGVTTRGAERLERLVMNLLIVSQIESGAMPVFAEEISMPDVVKERVETVLRDYANVELDVEAEHLIVRADRERLSQVVEHLLDNAVKFGGPNGRISVQVGRSNGYAHLAISDQGPGIAAADHERIFERFIRLGDVLTRETQGAGVGLFIAKSAVDAMDGQIWVESEPGNGATFHVQVPLARPVAVDEAESA